MPTTDYIVANGMMLGEITNGVMRNYGTDALGSVVHTYSNGVPENTYAYKPYGATLAKTGTAIDPSFLWNGGSGYRATTLAKAEYYVRNRHFSAKGAIWTSVDLYWPQQLPYEYVGSSPVDQADPSGLSTCNITSFTSDATTKPASCSASVEGGTLRLKAYKDVSFKCNASCSGGMSSCTIYQYVNELEVLSLSGGPPFINRTTGGFVLDGSPMCSFPPSTFTGNWNTQTYGLQGEDAPGYWTSNIAPWQVPCNKGYISPLDTEHPSSNKVSILSRLYEVLCGWSSSLPRKKRIAILKFSNCLNPLATVLIS